MTAPQPPASSSPPPQAVRATTTTATPRRHGCQTGVRVLAMRSMPHSGGPAEVSQPRWTSGPTLFGAPYTLSPMSRAAIERRLTDVSARARARREELMVADEQLAQLAAEAEDARLRALVSETPLADREHREAQRHATAMERHRTEVMGELAELETSQYELLDQLGSTAG